MMDDTPEHVKRIHLEIWMSKTPEERERLTIKNNEELIAVINELRSSHKKNYPGDHHLGPLPINYFNKK